MCLILFLFTININPLINCHAVLSPSLIFRDDNGNDKVEADITVKVTLPVILICKNENSFSVSFFWTKSDFESDVFIITTDHINTEATKSELKIGEVKFDQSGIYKCTVGANETKSSSTIRIHVYGILDYASAEVPIQSSREDIRGIIIYKNIPRITQNPKIYCKFQVGRNAVSYAFTRWIGHGITKFPQNFIIDNSVDAASGVIYSNLTMNLLGNELNQELFGNYSCRLHVVSGSCLQQNVSFSISPVIHRVASAEKAYVGYPFSVTCLVIAFPSVDKNGSISWRRNDHEMVENGDEVIIDDYNHEGRISFSSKNISHDTLNFRTTQLEDRAVYTCYVKTIKGNGTSGLYLRIKSMKSALWPAVGILLELAVLTVIILIHERNQSVLKKKRDQENAVDIQKQGRRSHKDSSGVRHR